LKYILHARTHDGLWIDNISSVRGSSMLKVSPLQLIF